MGGDVVMVLMQARWKAKMFPLDNDSMISGEDKRQSGIRLGPMHSSSYPPLPKVPSPDMGKNGR